MANKSLNKLFNQLIGLVTVITVITVITACDINITGPSISNSNTNTNTNTNTIDVHDTGSSFTPNNGTTTTNTPNGVASIPSGSQTIAETYAKSNQLTLSRSCQDTYGESAWLFMDGLIVTLRSSDPRWGYLTKTNGTISRDVIAYKGTSSNTGAWGVDVIIDLCGSPKFGWNVIGYDSSAQWTESRIK